MAQEEPTYYIQYNCWYDAKTLYISDSAGFYHNTYSDLPAFWSLKKLQRGFIQLEEYPEGRQAFAIRSELFNTGDIKTISFKATYLLITLKGESANRDSGILIEGKKELLSKINEALIFIKGF
jgi:hypothetical protein